MSLFNFVKKLMPHFPRSVVTDDLRVTEKEVSTIVIPSWEAAATYFRVNRPQSRAVKNMEQVFYKHVKVSGSKAPTFIHEIARSLPNFLENIREVQSQVDKHITKDVLADGMTARNAFLVRSASHMAVVSRYLSSLLNLIYTLEAEHLDQALPVELEISKAERIYIDRNFDNFCKLYKQYAAAPSDWKKKLGAVPEIYVTSLSEQGATAFYKGLDYDPLEVEGLSGFVGTAIYSARMVVARWQQDRYDSAVAKKQQLEFRLLYLQMRNDGEEGDPVVENEIRILQDRIETLDDRIRREEEKYGVFKG